ncbi:hypothetical protein F4678DRAFT_477875 [Xylaria arbuscula]|nr:hypothetical protein F4678DRAFT_477875 [Xylaria arbuscula]
MSFLPYLFLIKRFLWDRAERRLATKYIQRYKPFPLPTEKDRLFDVSDVSIIVPTVGFDPSSFSQALVSWLANKPREIIIVTIPEELQSATTLVNLDPIQAANVCTELKLLTIPLPNKRDQLVRGIRACTGKIIALADDDSYWNPHTLIHLLAPFQESDIGLVGGPIESYLPTERQDPSVITAWEVAALRMRSKRRGGNKAFYVADGSTNFTVSGATILLRAEVLKDPIFQFEFAEERFQGVRMNTGDDSFITRWVLFQHLREDRKGAKKWRLGMQITPEAQVTTSLIPDRRFAEQVKRWARTALRFRLTSLFRDPGLRNFRRETPYMCRKMIESMCNPFLNLLWYVCFFLVLRDRPLLGTLIALYYIYGIVSGILAFSREFPFTRRKIWAAFLVDRVSMVSDWYCWLTLGQESWASRRGVDRR